jgi:hypothetical protein
MNPVTLHVSLAPVDWRYAEHVLPHQMRTWAGQVDEVQFTLDLKRGKGRFGASGGQEEAHLRQTVSRLCEQYPHAHLREVDYSPDAAAGVADRFLGGKSVPEKSHYGAPFYSYFFGWHTARHDIVFHMDSDMMFGGGSQTWVEEALSLLLRRSDVLMCSPLPGPPTEDGDLPPHMVAAHSTEACRVVREGGPALAYRMGSCSSRLFLMDRRTLAGRVGPMIVRPPKLRSHLRARIEGHIPAELPEAMMTRSMRQAGMFRLDFLGEAPGMWSLHPRWRSEDFYTALPELIARIEAGDVPQEQRGDYDINDSMVDWTSARAAAADQLWRRRLRRHARAVIRR